MNFSYSTIGFADRSLGAALDAIAGAGFAGIELVGTGTSFTDWQAGSADEVPAPPTGRAATEFLRQITRRGLRAETIHAPMRRNVLGAPSENWRREKVAVLGNFLRFAGEIGATGVVIHGIPNPMFLPEDRPLAAWIEPMVQAMTRSVDELVPVAAEAGVRMLLENLPYQRDLDLAYPLIRMCDLRPFVDAYPPEQVGLVVDTGHAWTNGDEPVAEILTAGDRLWGTHLQDVPRENPNDDHWVPTKGGLDWPAICATLQTLGYPGAWTFEVSAADSAAADEMVHQSRAVAVQWEKLERKQDGSPVPLEGL